MSIQSLINQVKIINEKYETIKKINGENFNIFSILNLERKEVETHSYFIYNLLNPKGSHNQGDKFLQIFLKQILKKKEYKKIGLILADKVEREKIITNAKRIDFTIETSKFFIAIEMKVDASDQDKQLYDYYKYSEKQGKDFKLFYLTLDGKKADEKSTKKLEVNKDYFLLSFQYNIYTWIEKCIEKTATIPTLREGLVHYKNLIQKLTNQMGNEMDKDMIDIIKTPTDIKAMYTIHNEYAKVLAKKESDFWFEIYDKIDNKKLKDFKVLYLTDSNIVDERIDYNGIVKERKNKNSYLGLSFVKEIGKFQIICELYQKSSDNHIVIDFSLLENEKNLNLSKKSEILKNIGFEKEYKENNRWFYLKEKISFYGSGEPTFELFDDKKFEELVESTSKEVIETLKKILEKENELLKDV